MDLSDTQHDALREIGNVGIGNAATALSKLMNKRIALHMPESTFVPIERFAELAGGAESQVVSLYLEVQGDLHGETFFFFDEKEAIKIVNMMGLQETDMSEMAVSAYKEMSNIFGGAYLNSIAEMLDLTLLPGIPNYGHDMLGALVDGVLVKYGAFATELLLIKTPIEVEGDQIDGMFLFFFDEESLEKIVKVLGEKFGVA